MQHEPPCLSTSFGLDSLEVPTKGLRLLRVLDIALLPPGARRDLIGLGRSVWEAEKPIDWATDAQPGRALRALDSWLLEQRGVDLRLEKLYEDLRNTCRGRLRLARDKAAKSKKVSRQNVGEVGRGVADRVRPLIESKGFPEAFVPKGSETVRVEAERKSGIVLQAIPMLGSMRVSVRIAANDRPLIDGNYRRSVGQVLVAALLMGRSVFQMPTNEEVAAHALENFLRWRREFVGLIEEECRKSSLGTRFDEEIRRSVYIQLGVAPEIATEQEFEGKFTLDSPVSLPRE